MNSIINSNKLKFILIGMFHKYSILIFLKTILEINQLLKSDLKGPYPSFLKRSFLKKNALPNKDWCETGSYYGGTIDFLSKIDKNSIIHSIELSKELFTYCKKRFSKNNKIRIYNGKACDLLPEILSLMKTGGNFFLDDHYSGGLTAGFGSKNSILYELEIIFKYYGEKSDKNSNSEIIIFIDDIRYTMSKSEYFQVYPTFDEIIKIVNQYNASYYVAFDMIVIQKKY